MTSIALLAGAVLFATVAAAEAPRFEDYPVADRFKAKPASPILSSPRAQKFRTVLRRAAASGPNFAGHFTLARWGCGAGCVSWAIIDARSGAVWFAPFQVWDARTIGDAELVHHSIDFELDSELIVANGARNGEGAGTYYYRWHRGLLSLIHSIEYDQ